MAAYSTSAFVEIACVGGEVVTVARTMGAFIAKLLLLGYPPPRRAYDALRFDTDAFPLSIALWTEALLGDAFEQGMMTLFDARGYVVVTVNINDFDEAWEYICAWVQ